MASIEINHRVWNETYQWLSEGDEWSEKWGSAEQQWFTLTLPRIYHYVPAAHVLEIAPGHGRWTQFLLSHASKLSVIDLSEKCIDYCKDRFAAHNHLSYHVNNGRSLGQIEDGSVDFVFSFDSLVHAEMDVMRDYLKEIKRVLGPGGTAVLHHSNLGACRSGVRWRFRRWGMKVMRRIGLQSCQQKLPHWRAPSVSSERMRDAANQVGLSCTGQEIFKWLSAREKTDCISVFWKGNVAENRR
jgi:ubiquinone/menaquinone biosynthesis C-methylase UbiE